MIERKFVAQKMKEFQIEEYITQTLQAIHFPIIAIPIIAQSMDGVLRDMDRAAKLADIIELRIDYMVKPNLEILLNHSPIPKIVANRVKSEGGRFQGPEEKRIAYLQEAIALGAEYVDIELRHYHTFERGNTKLIVSYHDLNMTPENLEGIYRKIAEKNPDIIKMATRPRSKNDNLRMLNLICNADREIIGVCTGKEGIITRIYGPPLGGNLTYASLDKAKSLDEIPITALELRREWKIRGLRNFKTTKTY